MLVWVQFELVMRARDEGPGVHFVMLVYGQLSCDASVRVRDA
jgi:hypothetical protein